MRADTGELVSVILANWDMPSASSPSFEAGGYGEGGIPRWRVSLPADHQTAEEALARLEARQGEIEGTMAGLPDRIDRLVTELEIARAGTVSFGQSGSYLPPPERELIGLINFMNDPAQDVFFSPGEDRAGKFDALFNLFRTEMETLLGFMAHLAIIETEIDGKLIGRTIAGWNGDLETAWNFPLRSTDHELHRRSLAQALASRSAILRISLLIIGGAARLAPLLTNPAGALLSLPLTWNFIRQILSELDEYPRISPNLL